MHDSTISSDQKEHREDQLVTEDVALNKFLRWWYNFTAISPHATNTFEREQLRKSRFLSAIVLSLLLVFLLFIPGCLALPNKFVTVVDFGMMPICIISLFLNRAKKTMLAGLLLVIAFEAALVMVVLTTQPLDEPSIQQYELFVFGELLAVSLLNAGSVFPVAIFNSLFIVLSLLYQPQTAILAHDLQSQFWPLLLRPIGVQFLVAGVSYLWVSNAMRYMSLSFSAQEEALKQKELAEKDRQVLQQDIARLTQTYADAANKKVVITVPLHAYRQDFWSIIETYNALQLRLKHSQKNDQELQKVQLELDTLKNAIVQYSYGLNQRKISPWQPVQTKTALDPLLAAFRDHQRS
ncbi:hypothetical protein [Dictyobacter arantiisoli]|uniref:Uncharacterized protein n=1 Tax=Dictyobacter arantiisoli TaxID=2014874 RepID=A0A5A5TFW0_9CHLR|nr:hypothetical protein [Dictyobacter arantiisoli]GCF10460.1 hypothetical protein KDI_40240 [Dictyobacter arantiisoli]